MRCDGPLAYDLAHQLEANSCWRPWLGDHAYTELRQHLVSPNAWAALMRSEDTTPSRLRLQLRVRALLYDKALESILCSAPFDPACLPLQAHRVYFSLEQDALDWARLQAERAPTLAALQAKYGLDPRDVILSHHPVADNSKIKAQQRKLVSTNQKQGRSQLGFRILDQYKSFGRAPSSSRGNITEKDGEDVDLWYDQWLDKRLLERMHSLARRFSQRKLPFPEQDSFRRTSEGMATFVNLSRRARLGNQLESTIPNQEASGFSEEDLAILPESLLPNCVPDNPCPGNRAYQAYPVVYNDHLDSSASSTFLPGVSRHLLQKPGNGFTASRKIKLAKEEADAMARQTLAKFLETVGFEGTKQTAMELLCDLTTCHMRNLGNRLRILLDSYQKHLTTDDILRMFMHCAGGSLTNLRSLDEYVRNEKANSQVQQTEASISNNMQMALHHQHNLAYQQALKKKQLAAARANKRFDGRSGVEFPGVEAKPFVSGFPKQSWMGQQQQQQQQQPLHMAHSNHPQVLQQLRMQQPSGISGLAKTRIEEILGSDLKQELLSDDMDGTLGSPNRRKRKME